MSLKTCQWFPTSIRKPYNGLQDSLWSAPVPHTYLLPSPSALLVTPATLDSCWSSRTPGILPPQGLWTSWSLCLECSPPYILIAHSLTFFKSLCKYHSPYFKSLALFFFIAFFPFCIIQYKVYMIHYIIYLFILFIACLLHIEHKFQEDLAHSRHSINHCKTDS